MKKPEDSGRQFRAMIVVTFARSPACQHRLETVDEGRDQKATTNSGVAVIENWLMDDASFPEYLRRNLKEQSESPAQSESRLE